MRRVIRIPMKVINYIALAMLISSCDSTLAVSPLASQQGMGCFITDRITHVSSRSRTCNIRWETRDLPILLIPTPGDTGPGLGPDLAWAAEFINSHVGGEVFTLNPDQGGRALEVIEDDLTGGSQLGVTVWGWNEFRMVSARIAIWSGLSSIDAKVRRQVIVHELLHALGVEHDVTGCSVMKPVFDPRCPGILADDVRALRSLYGFSVAFQPALYDGVSGKEDVSGLAAATSVDGRRMCP